MIYAQWSTKGEICEFCGRPAFCVFKTSDAGEMMIEAHDTLACGDHMPEAFGAMTVLYGDSSCDEPKGLIAALGKRQTQRKRAPHIVSGDTNVHKNNH